jgi:hypothetical protein
MSKFILRNFYNKIPKNKYVGKWLETLSNCKTNKLSRMKLNKNGLQYGFYGEHIMNNYFYDNNKYIMKPKNEYLPMIDFIEEKNKIRKAIEVKTFIDTEIQDNKVKFLFSKNYYYVPSDIYLVELNEYRKLKNIYLMDGKKWFSYVKSLDKFYCNNFDYYKNKVLLEANLKEFTSLY